MHLLVLGATGGCGRHVLVQACERGHTVRALVRSATRFEQRPCEVIEGDIFDAATVTRALEGMHAVVSSLGMKRVNPKNPWSPLTPPANPTFNSAYARVLVEGMQRTGVKRVVAVSAAGVAESAARMNALMKFLVATSTIGIAYRDLAAMEDVFRATDLDWHTPRPTRLTNGPLTKNVVVTERFGWSAAISRADVAHYLLDSVERGGFQDHTPMITGA